MPKFDLDEKCPHYEFGTVKCSACETCISNWVHAHTDEEVEEKIEYLVKTNRAVAARRVQLVMEERQKRR